MNYFKTCLNYPRIIRLTHNTWFTKEMKQGEDIIGISTMPATCWHTVPGASSFLSPCPWDRQANLLCRALSSPGRASIPHTSGLGPTLKDSEFKYFSNQSHHAYFTLVQENNSWSAVAARSYGPLEAFLKANHRGGGQLRHLPVEPGPLLSTTVRSASSKC